MPRDVTTGVTGATTVAPKFPDVLTLFLPGGLNLPLHCKGRTKEFPAVTSLYLIYSWHVFSEQIVHKTIMLETRKVGTLGLAMH